MSEKKIKVEKKLEQTESGILIEKTEFQEKKPFFVKELSKTEFAVVDESGETARVYTKEKGCNDPEEAANSYAAKLSKRWISKK